MTDSQIPEINVKITSVEVKGSSKPIKMTVRNMFYRGFKGKLNTIWAWLWWHSDKSFKEYLDSPVTYVVESPSQIDTYHSIDAERELEELLKQELKNNIEENGKN